MEQVGNFSVGEEKALRACCCSKTFLLPLLLSCGSVRLLDRIILALSGRDGDVLTRV